MSAEIGYALTDNLPLWRVGIALDVTERNLGLDGRRDKVRDKNGLSVFGLAFKYTNGSWGLIRGVAKPGENYTSIFNSMGLSGIRTNIAIAEITRRDEGPKSLDFSAPCTVKNGVAGSVVGMMSAFNRSELSQTNFIREEMKPYLLSLKMPDKSALAFLYVVCGAYDQNKNDRKLSFTDIMDLLRNEECSFHLMFITPGMVHLVRSMEILERKGKPSRLFYSQSGSGLVFGSDPKALKLFKKNGKRTAVKEGEYLGFKLPNRLMSL